MALTVSDYAALTDDLQEVFNETAASAVADMPMMSKLFEVKESERRTYDMTILHGLNGIKKVAGGQELPTVTGNEGDSVTYTQSYYGAKVSITKEMRKFDLYDEMHSQVESITDDGFQKVEQSLADVLSNGWSTSYTDVYGESVSSVGPDGLALFSTAHTNNLNAVTYRNRIKNSAATEDPALSRDAIVEARANALVYSDPSGVIRPTKLDTLIVAPSNEDLAERILFSTQLSGSANNDFNPLKGKIPSLVVSAHLETRSDGTDTSAYWYLADSSKVKNTLKAKFAQKPMLGEAENVTETQNWLYPIDYFYSLGFGYQQYIWGSRGTA